MTAACYGGSIGPVAPVVPLQPRTLLIEGTTRGTVNDEFPLSAILVFDDASKETVTSKAVWSSSDRDVATVNAEGLLVLTGPGECDLTVSYTAGDTTLTASAKVSSEARPALVYTLFGVLSDGTNGGPVFGATVILLGGTNDGRTTTTDGNGYYSIPGLFEGTFRIRFTAGGYEPLEQTIDFTGDARRDFSLKEIPLPTFSDTYNISISTGMNTCANITPGSSGTITLSGTTRDLRVSITERRGGGPDYTRSGYRGSMRADGTFSAGVSDGVTNFRDVRSHDYRGGISGKVTGRSISGSEDMTITNGCAEGSDGTVSNTGRIILDFNGGN